MTLMTGLVCIDRPADLTRGQLKTQDRIVYVDAS